MSRIPSAEPAVPLPSGMSESESEFLGRVREMLQVTARGSIPFSVAMASLLSDLRLIRDRDWNVTSMVGPHAHSAIKAAIEANGTSRGGAISISHRQFLDDMDGLIDHSIKNGISFLPLAAVLAHDVGGLASHEWSLEKAKAEFFLPKSTGWAKRNREPIGEVEDVRG